MLISDINFSGPLDPNKGFQNKIAAVYAILDGSLKVIDVGQTDDLNNRFPNHPRSRCWNSNKSGEIYLYIYQIGNTEDRLSLESKIRDQYKPPCGEF